MAVERLRGPLTAKVAPVMTDSYDHSLTDSIWITSSWGRKVSAYAR